MADGINEILGEPKESNELFSSSQIKIVTAGFGGAGCNIVNRLMKAGVKGTDFVAVNTDAQHFKIIDERIKKVLIGKSLGNRTNVRLRKSLAGESISQFTSQINIKITKLGVEKIDEILGKKDNG